MYVAVKGGERAIDSAHAWLAEERRGDLSIAELTVPQIRAQLALAVNRVMARRRAQVLRDRDDVGTGLDHLPQHGFFADDFRPGADIGSRRRLTDQIDQIFGAADLIGLVVRIQPFPDGDGIERLVFFGQLDDGFIDDPVRLQIEIAVGQQITEMVDRIG